MKEHGFIVEALKKKQVNTNVDVEFDIMQLYNYLKSYVMAKFKVPGIKLKKLELDTNFFKADIAIEKEKFDPISISNALTQAIATKFGLKTDDIKIMVSGNSNSKENLLIDIEYKKKFIQP